MRVVVVGVGRAGRGVLATLLAQHHLVTVVDNDPSSVAFVEEHFDVGIVAGYGANPKVLADAGCADADLVVALTDQDETNLVAAQTALSLGARRAIARVQGEGWADLGGGDGIQPGVLGVNLVFHPRVLVAREMARVARSHGALEVIDLAEDAIEVVKLPVAGSSRYASKVLSRLGLPRDMIVGAVVRDGELFVPGGADVLLPGDEVYLLGRREAIDAVQEHITDVAVAGRVAIVGGGVTGFALARMLSGMDTRVMLIDKDPDVAERLAEELPKVTVIVGDGTDLELMREHRVEDCDFLAAVTEDEEVNLLAGLLASKLGVKRVATVVHRTEFHAIYHQIGIDVVLSPHTMAEEQVVRNCRDELVRSLTVLGGGAAEVVELVVGPQARIAGKTLMQVRFPRGAIVCALVKGTGVVVPRGSDIIEPGDTAVVLTTPEAFDAMAWHFKKGLF